MYVPRVQFPLSRPAALHESGRRLAMCPCVEVQANDKQREYSSRQRCWPLHEVPRGPGRCCVRAESVGLKGSYDTAMVRLSLASETKCLGATGEQGDNRHEGQSPGQNSQPRVTMRGSRGRPGRMCFQLGARGCVVAEGDRAIGDVEEISPVSARTLHTGARLISIL